MSKNKKDNGLQRIFRCAVMGVAVTIAGLLTTESAEAQFLHNGLDPRDERNQVLGLDADHFVDLYNTQDALNYAIYSAQIGATQTAYMDMENVVVSNAPVSFGQRIRRGISEIRQFERVGLFNFSDDLTQRLYSLQNLVGRVELFEEQMINVNQGIERCQVRYYNNYVDQIQLDSRMQNIMTDPGAETLWNRMVNEGIVENQRYAEHPLSASVIIAPLKEPVMGSPYVMIIEGARDQNGRPGEAIPVFGATNQQLLNQTIVSQFNDVFEYEAQVIDRVIVPAGRINMDVILREGIQRVAPGAMRYLGNNRSPC